MFGLTKLWQAVATLTANLTALAETVGTINTGLRQHIGLDGYNPLETPALMPPRPQEAPGATEVAAGPAGRQRGRRKAA